MRKIKPEKVAGIVALSYLVLIPVGALYVYKKLQGMDEDVSTMWTHLEMDPEKASDLFQVEKAKQLLREKIGWRDDDVG